MVEFRGIELQGDVGAKYFVLRNGQKTKMFYDAGKLDFRSGQFPIYNENMQIVEYMDVMGTFSSKSHKHIAISLYYYIISEYYIPNCSMVYSLGILSFPSKHFVDPKVKDFILEEERFRDQLMRDHHASLLERLRYKHAVNLCLKKKLKRANKLAKQREIELKQEQEELSV